jgi:predicted DNA-binding transcriptional regulator AlpA
MKRIQDPRERPTLSLPEAAVWLGLGRSAAYDAVRRGDWPTPVLRIGRRLRVPTAAVLRVLELDSVHGPCDSDAEDP